LCMTHNVFGDMGSMTGHVLPSMRQGPGAPHMHLLFMS
jgi:hypothetical protein